MKLKLDTFEDKLRRKTRPKVIFSAASGALLSLLSIGIFFYLLMILSYFLPHGLGFYVSKKFMMVVAVSVPVGVGLFLARWERRDLRHHTLMIEQHYPQLRDRLLTVVEISGKRNEIDQNPFSRLLANSLEADMNALMDRFGFQGAFSPRKLIPPAVLLILLVMVGSVHAMVQPHFFTVGFGRLTEPSFMPPPQLRSKNLFDIQVIPGDTEIGRGSSLMIQAMTPEYRPKQVELYFKTDGETAWQIFPMESVSADTFQFLMDQVARPGIYFVKADGQDSSIYKIKLIEALQLSRASWTIEFPSYMHLKTQNRQGWNGKITVPQGTKLRVELSFNQAVQEGRILQRGEMLFAAIRKSPNVLEANFTASKDLLLNLDIKNSSGELKLEAPAVWIQTLPDLAPYIEVLEPQTHNYVFPTQEIPFEISVNDDYGLRSIDLVLRYQEKEERIPWLPEGKASDNIMLKPVLQLEKLQLHPRDLVFAYLEVRDTFPQEDPGHVVKSPLFVFLIRDFVEQYKINLPKRDLMHVRQIFEDILSDQEKIMQDTWDVITMPPKNQPLGWEAMPETEDSRD